MKVLDYKSQAGSLLLMSMLILAGIITAAGTTGVIVIQSLRQGIAVDEGLVAYYAAESGVEDGLYELRKNETAASSLPGSGTLTNTASWARTITTTTATLTKTITQNDSWEVNLYDPDTSLSPLSNPIKSVRLAWTGASAWVEAQLVPWNTSGSLQTPSTQMFSSASNPAILNLQDATTVLYRLRFKALYANITNLTITAYSGLNATGVQVNIPAQVTLLSTGTFRRNKQAVRATMPQRSPLSGVFDYVLFSEENLIKQ